MMNWKTYIFIYIFISVINLSFSQKASNSEIDRIVSSFLTMNNHAELTEQKPDIEKVYSNYSGELLFYVYNFRDAFIVVSADKSNIPIKAFSFDNRLNIEYSDNNIHLKDILVSDYENFKSFLIKQPDAKVENEYKWNNLLFKNKIKNTNDTTYGPFLSSLYGQVNCHDNNGHLVNVTNYYTPNHYAAGCVALTFTEVMRYYNWPRKGVGSFSYTDSYGSSTGTYDADFEEGYYNWDMIPDRFDGVESSDQQRSELGKLAFNAAVSVRMDFEYNGSTSNVNRIPNAASKYFRYSADYKEKTAYDFWQTLDTSLCHSIPAQFAVYTSGGAGHAVVGDGIKYIGGEKYYHLNMGWWGDDNGWYQIHQSFNAGGYSNVTAAVLNMIPVPEIEENPETDAETKTVFLKWYYTDKIIPDNYELQFKKGSAEWETLSDTFKMQTYPFKVDGENDYMFRVRAQINNEWKSNSWSNEIKISPSDFKVKGDEEMTLYPTMAFDKIKVSYMNLSGSSVTIYDLNGNLMYQNLSTISDNEFSIDISAFQSGFYILQIANDTEKKSAKFLKL